MGFYLVGLAEPPLTATLRAFDAAGAEIGVLTTTTSLDSRTVFFGARAAAATIRRIRLDYGPAARSEEIDDLCFTATDPDEGEGEADPTIELTNCRVLPVAAQLVPLSAVPGSQLPAFSGSPGTGPVGSILIGSVPIGVRSAAFPSAPFPSAPSRSAPSRSARSRSGASRSAPSGSRACRSARSAWTDPAVGPADRLGRLLGTNVPIRP